MSKEIHCGDVITTKYNPLKEWMIYDVGEDPDFHCIFIGKLPNGKEVLNPRGMGTVGMKEIKSFIGRWSLGRARAAAKRFYAQPDLYLDEQDRQILCQKLLGNLTDNFKNKASRSLLGE